jgi:CubicO group peptidase (beta-lactamase class C family)
VQVIHPPGRADADARRAAEEVENSHFTAALAWWSPRDLAKFGSLYLHGGQWNGRQVIPADWIQLSTRRHFPFRPRTGPDAGGEFGYSYFWWYSCYPTARGLVEARTAVGNGQQRIFELPGLDMVVTILAGRYNDFTTGSSLGPRILRQHVIPAVKTGARAGCPGA